MEGNKLVCHVIGKKLSALKILDFSETQIEGEHPYGVPTIFTGTLQIFATMHTPSKKKCGPKFLHILRPKSE